jgi:3-carboxy-cis,cis-muconate cycloisomerase
MASSLAARTLARPSFENAFAAPAFVRAMLEFESALAEAQAAEGLVEPPLPNRSRPRAGRCASTPTTSSPRPSAPPPSRCRWCDCCARPWGAHRRRTRRRSISARRARTCSTPPWRCASSPASRKPTARSTPRYARWRAAQRASRHADARHARSCSPRCRSPRGSRSRAGPSALAPTASGLPKRPRRPRGAARRPGGRPRVHGRQGPAVRHRLALRLGSPTRARGIRIAMRGSTLLGRMAPGDGHTAARSRATWRSMAQPEVGEMLEAPPREGVGASSAMPHKRNPVGCAHATRRGHAHARPARDRPRGLGGEHERGARRLAVRSATVPEIAGALGSSLDFLDDHHRLAGGERRAHEGERRATASEAHAASRRRAPLRRAARGARALPRS